MNGALKEDVYVKLPNDEEWRTRAAQEETMGGIKRKGRVKKEGKEWKAGELGQEATGKAKSQRAKAVMGNATIERGRD